MSVESDINVDKCGESEISETKLGVTFLEFRTVVGESMLQVFFSCPHGGRGKYFGGFF